jgi:hypothetical protein
MEERRGEERRGEEMEIRKKGELLPGFSKLHATTILCRLYLCLTR